MSDELALIDFHGDQIAATLHEGEVFASVRHMCDALGLDYSTQLKKLRQARWGRVGIMPTHDAAGRMQDLAMIPEKAVPMWLAGISSGKVKPDLREKLERYQDEMAEVLARYFAGEVQPAHPNIDMTDPTNVMLIRLAEQHTRMQAIEAEEKRLWREIVATKEAAYNAQDTAKAALETVNGYSGYLSVLAYSRRHRLNISSGQLSAISRLAGKKCVSLGLESKDVPDARWTSVKVFPIEVLEGLHDEFVARSSNANLQLVKA